MRPAAPLLSLLICSPFLSGQAIYQARPASDPYCPRIEEHEDTLFRRGGQAGTTGGTAGAVVAEIMGQSKAGQMVPKAERESAGSFAVVDSEGKTIKVADLKGKIIVVGFWQTGCPPSINLLNEMADYQTKGEKFNFEVWPVAMDDKKWSSLTPFLQQNRKFLSKTKVYLPGLGEAGPAVFIKVLPVLPALFIIDREGKVAFKKFGYEPNALVAALKQILVEK